MQMSAVDRFTRYLVSAALLAGCVSPAEKEREPVRPNVVIVMVDALRADHLGVNGYSRPTTPNIDALASDGVNFTHGFAHSTWTKPSVATLFTSVYPGQHGLNQVVVTDEGGAASQILASEWVTLAERFQAAGYRTVGIVNQTHVTEGFGFAQGFEHFEAHRAKGAFQLNRRFKRWANRQTDSIAPLFLYMHYLDVHWPYIERVDELREVLGPLSLSTRPPRSGAASVQEWGKTLALPSDLQALISRYDHGVAYTDRQVGQLMEILRQLDLFESSIVLVTSDHGEAFLEHGELLHGHAPFDEMIRVPLLLRLPSRLRPEKRSVDAPVGLIDVLPTLLDLSGLEAEPQSEGGSLVPVMRGVGQPNGLVFAESDSTVAARSSDHKVIASTLGDGARFFDLREDPAELEPQNGDCGPPCDRLRAGLAAYLERMETSRKGLQTELAPFTEEELEALRRLGYLD